MDDGIGQVPLNHLAWDERQQTAREWLAGAWHCWKACASETDYANGNFGRYLPVDWSWVMRGNKIQDGEDRLKDGLDNGLARLKNTMGWSWKELPDRLGVAVQDVDDCIIKQRWPSEELCKALELDMDEYKAENRALVNELALIGKENGWFDRWERCPY